MNRLSRIAAVKPPAAWVSWIAAGVLLFTATGCYTQLAGTYRDYDREPDYEEVVAYEGEYGDSVVVSRYYYDDEYYDDQYYDQPYRYRRYFSSFYGYPSYGGYYNDPFYYDPFYYGSGFNHGFGFGFGHHGFGFGFGHHGFYNP